MGIQDFIVTPVYLIVFYVLAFLLRNNVSTPKSRKYFIPALSLKFLGAILLGFVYQFYYQGGDTFNFWTHGSKHIYDAFVDSPIDGLEMIFGDIKNPKHNEYYSQIWLRRSDSNLFVIRLAAFIDLFTFHTYTATALFFAIISFSGTWALYQTITQIVDKERAIAIVLFAIPSIVFWGSGILKDSIMIGALGSATSSLLRIIELRNRSISTYIILFVALLIIFEIKVYILLCYIPSVFALIFFKNLHSIKSLAFKILAAPTLLIIFIGMGYLSANYIGAESSRYSLESIPEWSRITAYDIGYWTGKDAGSQYSLGELDGTWQTMLANAPAAINVALFRPYVWEVSSLFMLLTALESLVFLLISLYLIFSHFKKALGAFVEPITSFFLIYTLTFAFAVGVSTFNFGTLARYRIPMLPFFGLALVMSLPEKKTKQKNA